MLSASQVANAQFGSIWDGTPGDSVVFDFMPGDSLLRADTGGWTNRIGIDTTGMQLWQIGQTTKGGFLPQGASAIRGIMTDTLQPYPTLQDGSFVFVGFTDGFNGMNAGAILTFEHRYQTAAGKDGGFVELSVDGGATWESIYDFTSPYPVTADNFYSRSDILTNGTPAFSGSSNGYIRSRLQFPFPVPLRSGEAASNKTASNEIWVRFRFTSDSTADSLAGWAIRRIALERDQYLGVTDVSAASTCLSFSPNPSATGIYHLDDAFNLTPDQRYEVRNALGAVVLSGKPERTFGLSHLPKGLYWIRIWGKTRRGVGRVILK